MSTSSSKSNEHVAYFLVDISYHSSYGCLLFAYDRDILSCFSSASYVLWFDAYEFSIKNT